MYFHSSSYRHEQYAALRSAARSVDANKKNDSKKKRSSLSSNTSGADSGYTSSTSSSPNGTQPSPISLRAAAEETTAIHSQQHKSQPLSPSSLNNIDNTNNIAIDDSREGGTSTPTKKPKKKSSRTKNQLQQQQQQQRQPDLVYSCPRPLAFPFHNDAHFLPVAEADPRDVARVAPPNPSSSRRQSAASSKASSLASNSQFDQHSAYRYHRSLRSKSSSIHSSTRPSTDDFTDTETLRSQRTTSSSIISSMHRGTVRSLRSLFQIPTPHHHPPPPPSSPMPPPISSTTFQQERSPSVSSSRPPSAEIKRGTVRSIREIFSSSPQLDATTSNNLAIAERNAQVNSKTSRILGRLSPIHRNTKKQQQQQQQQQQRPEPVKSRSRAASVVSNATTLCNKPLPKEPHKKDLIDNTSTMDQLLANAPTVPSKPPSSSAFANFKRMFTREKKKSPLSFSSSSLSSSPQQQESSALSSQPPPLKSSTTSSTLVPPSIESTTPALSIPSQPRPPRRSLLASWLRPDPSPKKNKSSTTSQPSNGTTSTTTATESSSETNSNNDNTKKTVKEEQAPPTVVGRLWKSFKRMVIGKKSSRVGVL
ncbi:hypothetical protein BDC45DRAFT_494656 [Circinella umbellata]|nr:hypothetical protein BDC45DRAFT_494656 [Circinella umbellata]